MNIDAVARRLKEPVLTVLADAPVISAYARNRGWPFILAWGHRISGIILAAYLLFHIYTLSYLHQPAAYDAQMRVYSLFIFSFLEWALAVPVAFHALNGGRLILYEIFGFRNDDLMIRWVFGLGGAYLFVLGLLMIIGDQTVSPVFFWLTVLTIAAAAAILVWSRLKQSGLPWTWKIQRLTGGFLLVMICAHMFFMHLNPSLSHEAGAVIDRMRHIFIKIVDLALLLAVLFHGGYGLLAIAKDYISSKVLTGLAALAVIVLMTVFGWIGVKLTLLV